MEQTSNTGGTLADELRNVLNQAEALLQAIGDESDESLAALRERVHVSVDTARARLADLEKEATQASERAVIAAESWIRQNPWTALAVCFGIGLIAGAIVGRGTSRASGSHERTPRE